MVRIKVIVHTNELREMLEYMQESSRAGWDGGNSEVIVIRSKIKRRKKAEGKNKKEASKKEKIKIKKFLLAKYQRMVMDKYLDNKMDQKECKEGKKKY